MHFRDIYFMGMHIMRTYGVPHGQKDVLGAVFGPKSSGRGFTVGGMISKGECDDYRGRCMKVALNISPAFASDVADWIAHESCWKYQGDAKLGGSAGMKKVIAFSASSKFRTCRVGQPYENNLQNSFGDSEMKLAVNWYPSWIM